MKALLEMENLSSQSDLTKEQMIELIFKDGGHSEEIAVHTIDQYQGDENDIVIDHMGVSGTHAQIAMEGQSVILTDLKSTNGTFVNGQRVERVELRPNDWISIGKHILTLKAGPR